MYNLDCYNIPTDHGGCDALFFLSEPPDEIMIFEYFYNYFSSDSTDTQETTDDESD